MKNKGTVLNYNKLEINRITKKLREIEPQVLLETGIESNKSLNGIYGGKYAVYINLLDEIITSPDHFINLYMNGFKKQAKNNNRHDRYYNLLVDTLILQEWLMYFLKRTYLRNYDALSKKRPPTDEACMILGQNDVCYGLFVTPRKNLNTGKWENDKSEIRHLTNRYWSIGHILKAGIVDFQSDKLISFDSIKVLLNYTKAAIVTPQKSRYCNELFDLYENYVLSSIDNLNIPFLIPEFRYEGLKNKHIYRLDFTIIFPNEDNNDLNKIGIEISPWSSHGEMTGLKGKNQTEINEIAKQAWENEMQKRRDYFLKYNINVFTYTDSNLHYIDTVWEDISRFLTPKMINRQNMFYIFNKTLI